MQPIILKTELKRKDAKVQSSIQSAKPQTHEFLIRTFALFALLCV